MRGAGCGNLCGRVLCLCGGDAVCGICVNRDRLHGVASAKKGKQGVECGRA